MSIKTFSICVFVCSLSIWILLNVPFPTNSAGDMFYIVQSVYEMIHPP